MTLKMTKKLENRYYSFRNKYHLASKEYLRPIREQNSENGLIFSNSYDAKENI